MLPESPRRQRWIEGGRGPVQLGRQRQTGRPGVDKNSHSLGPQPGRSRAGGWLAVFCRVADDVEGSLTVWGGWEGVIVHVSKCQLSGTPRILIGFLSFSARENDKRHAPDSPRAVAGACPRPDRSSFALDPWLSSAWSQPTSNQIFLAQI